MKTGQGRQTAVAESGIVHSIRTRTANSSPAALAFQDRRPASVVQNKLRSGLPSGPDFQLAARAQSMADVSPGATLQRSRIEALQDSSRRSPSKSGLPQKLQTGIEHLSGIAMHDVKVHYHSSKPAQLNAHAFAQGRDIHLATGQEKHLPHEAWHVVQQQQGRVKPTLQMAGAQINDDARLESEADRMGARALQAGGENLQTGALTPLHNSGTQNHAAPLQGVWKPSPFHQDYYQWHTTLAGVRWYAGKHADDMYFVIEHLSDENRALLKFQKIVRPYTAWVELGFTPLDADNSIVEPDETPDELPKHDYSPFIITTVAHRIEKGQVTTLTSHKEKLKQSEFEETSGAPKAGGVTVGYAREDNIGKYVFHLTTLRNILSHPELAKPGSGVLGSGLDPKLGGGKGGASETSEVTGDREMIEGSQKHSVSRIATTSSRDNIKLYTNQRFEYTEEQFGKGLYSEHDVTEREPILLRFKIEADHIPAMEIDPQHPKDKYVRLIKDIPISPDKIEALTSEGWVPLLKVDLKTLLEIMPRLH